MHGKRSSGTAQTKDNARWQETKTMKLFVENENGKRKVIAREGEQVVLDMTCISQRDLMIYAVAEEVVRVRDVVSQVLERLEGGDAVLAEITEVVPQDTAGKVGEPLDGAIKARKSKKKAVRKGQ